MNRKFILTSVVLVDVGFPSPLLSGRLYAPCKNLSRTLTVLTAALSLCPSALLPRCLIDVMHESNLIKRRA